MKLTRVLVLGGTGMVGHKMFQVLSSRPHLEVFATARDLKGLEGCQQEVEAQTARAKAAICRWEDNGFLLELADRMVKRVK